LSIGTPQDGLNTGARLDYIYEHDVLQMPHGLMLEIEAIVEEEASDNIRAQRRA
jgi:hypothetical protein